MGKAVTIGSGIFLAIGGESAFHSPQAQSTHNPVRVNELRC